VKRICVYAGSVRPGGGLTAVAQVAEALAVDPSVDLTVFTGSGDSGVALARELGQFDNVTIRPFLSRWPAHLRYAASKMFFMSPWIRFDWVVSINYFIPTHNSLAVYHLNLLSFVRDSYDGVGMRLRRADARVAVRWAQLNLFESDYLLNAAMRATHGGVRNGEVLYLGVRSLFFKKPGYESDPRGEAPSRIRQPNVTVLLVSSAVPHKDNVTVLRAFRLLRERQPEVPWSLKILGGQRLDHWDSLMLRATEMGIAESLQIQGPVAATEVSSFMEASLCLVSASLVESFGMVAVEAMASRCPVVVTSATSMPESVGSAAIMVPPGDFVAMAEAVLSLYDDPDLRESMIRRGVDRAEAMSPERFGGHLRRHLGIGRGS